MEAVVLVSKEHPNSQESLVLKQYVEQLSQRLKQPVYLALGEFLQHAVYEAMTEAWKVGASKIHIMPYFLFESKKREDEMLESIKRFNAYHPDVHVSLCQAIGYDEELLELLVHRIQNSESAL